MSGSVEYMPVSDALADAETLMEFLGFYGLTFLGTARPAMEAEAAGQKAAKYLKSGLWDGGEIYAFEAARLAFRAVPGLRGDK